MVFHAYTFHKDDSHLYNFLITAPSQAVVDQWFRWTNEDGHVIERVSPELYGYDYAAHWPWDMVQGGGKNASQLKNKILFTRSWNRDTEQHFMFPNQFAPDHRSGKTYYIRSKSHPQVFWAEDGGAIYATKHSRTKFRISIPGAESGKVMIPEDKVTITAFTGGEGTELGEYNLQADGGALYLDAAQRGGGGLVQRGHNFSSRTLEFPFAAFKNAFLPVGKDGLPADAKILYVSPGIGEEWELVE